MYDANDLPAELSAPLAIGVRKRLDPRRNTKPKKPDAQLLVCTPFDPDGFNFSKIRNPGEVMLELDLNGAVYRVLTNKCTLLWLEDCQKHLARQLTRQSAFACVYVRPVWGRERAIKYLEEQRASDPY